MMPMNPAPPQILVTAGNVHATADQIITPNGSWPVAETSVTVQDGTIMSTHTPAWAIVMVVLFIWFFLLSLLFLLAKEQRVHGVITVSVWSARGNNYTEHIPVYSAVQRADVLGRLNYLQGLVGAAQGRNRLG